MSEARARVTAARAPTNTHRSSLIAQHLQAVLFDLDGTLVDSVESIVRSFTHATQSLLGTTVPREAIVATIGRPLEPTFEALAPGRGAELLQTYRAYLNEHHDALVRAFPGTIELLAELRGRGYALGIVTAKSRMQAELSFRLCALEPLVEVTICHEDAERHKPAPDPLLAAARRLGLPPAACLYVGDSVFDLMAARAAGMASAAVTWGAGTLADLEAQAPELIVHAPAELLAHCPPRA